jgi:hypothetical protein
MSVVKVPVDAQYPRLRILASEFLRLGDYSATFPTGTTIGKRWRRLDGSFDQEFIKAGGQPRWLIGEYYDIGNSEKVGIRWFKPVIVLQSRSGNR